MSSASGPIRQRPTNGTPRSPSRGRWKQDSTWSDPPFVEERDGAGLAVHIIAAVATTRSAGGQGDRTREKERLLPIPVSGVAGVSVRLGGHDAYRRRYPLARLGK